VIEHKEHEEQLREYQQQLRHLASELSLAEERDRRRFAQELHDRIGQLLAVAKIKLAKLIDAQQETSDPLGELMEMLEIAIHETRSLTFELSPPVLQELGFEAALAWLVTKFQNQHGIATTFTDDEQPKPLIADLQVVLFQAVRELLHNTAKYSQADNAAVSISRQNNYLVVEVSDDGIGFDAKTVLSRCCKEEGFGLFSIRERLSHFGGTMEVRSALKRGARITLTAPLESAATAIASSSTPAPAHAPRDSIHVLLVDDHKIAREGIRSLLADCLDIEVVAEAADGEEAIRLVRERAPEVVVMDAAMPGMGGVEATRRIMAGFPATKVVALSMHTDRQYVTDMLAAGVAGYLLKDCAQEDLAQAIRAVNAQLMFFSPGIAENVVREHHLAAATTDASVESLTSREREVLTLLAEGFNSKQIASRCRISTKTVESHRQHIAKKLNLHSVAKLTKYAIRKGLTSLEL